MFSYIYIQNNHEVDNLGAISLLFSQFTFDLPVTCSAMPYHEYTAYKPSALETFHACNSVALQFSQPFFLRFTVSINSSTLDVRTAYAFTSLENC